MIIIDYYDHIQDQNSIKLSYRPRAMSKSVLKVTGEILNEDHFYFFSFHNIIEETRLL